MAGVDESVRAVLGPVDALAGMSAGALERRLADLERAAAAIAAQQMAVIAEMHSVAEAADTAQAAAERESSDGTTVPTRPRRAAGLAMVVGLACKASPSTGKRAITRSRRTITSLPGVWNLLDRGVLTAERAHVIADAAAVLGSDGCAALDARIGERVDLLIGASTQQIRDLMAAWVAEIDADAVLARRDAAVKGRRVTSRPLPDGMARVSITVPVEQCARIIGSLNARAAQVMARGDDTGRSRSQIIADLAVTRLTGQSIAAAVPTTVNLVVSDHTRLAGGRGAARLGDGTAIPAPLARRLVADSLLTPPGGPPGGPPPPAPVVEDGDPPIPAAGDYGAAARDTVLDDLPPATGRRHGPPPPSSPPSQPPLNPTDPEQLTEMISDLIGHLADVTARNRALLADAAHARRAAEAATATALRVVYACPDSGALTATRSRARTFPTALATLIDLRDGGICRTPYCGNPIAHHDHTVPHSRGGPTSAANSEGLCVTCNLVKDASGLTHTPTATSTGLHAVTIITPGHRYTATAPPLPTPLGPDAA